MKDAGKKEYAIKKRNKDDCSFMSERHCEEEARVDPEGTDK